MLLVGLVVTWRILSGMNESTGGELTVRSSEFDYNVIHNPKPVLVSFEAEW